MDTIGMDTYGLMPMALRRPKTQAEGRIGPFRGGSVAKPQPVSQIRPRTAGKRR